MHGQKNIKLAILKSHISYRRGLISDAFGV